MITVALIGPDGAGKTTVARRLQDELAVPVRYIYMGVNLDASNCLLPTSRLIRWLKRRCGAQPDVAGPPPLAQEAIAPRRGPIRGLARTVKTWLSLINRVAEQWYRQGVACYHRWRGRVVVFDRHFFSDYHAYDIAPTGGKRSMAKRLHGLMLQRVYPKPDLVIYLDAPAEVLLARKGEGTLASLERRRGDYMQLHHLVHSFAVVDATQPARRVAEEVARRITECCDAMMRRRRGGAVRANVKLKRPA